MGIKLLIADDEDTIRNGISKYIQLHTDRYDEIFLAADGNEASDIIFKYRPDIMLIDIQMPLKDGIEVMQEVTRAGILPDTLILSGFDEFRYAQQAVRLGAKDYLLKPCRSSDILKKIDELADKRFGSSQKKEEEDLAERNNIVELAKRYMEDNYFKNLTLEEVAEKVGITAGYLSTLFTRTMGLSFVESLNQIRVEHACTYLMKGCLKTYEIAYKVGFNDEKYFSKVFKKIKGVSPKEYRKYLIQD